MLYRNLGNSGIKVSVLSYGNWVNSNLEDGYKLHYEMIKYMFEKGCNFFDTAEGYDQGLGEQIMGKCLNKLQNEEGVQRSDYVLSTKIFFGAFKEDKLPINNNGTSRKHLIEGVNRSLKNLEHEYVDVLFCHRYDTECSTEEVVLAMKTLLNQNKIMYWATSEWPAIRIMEAIHIADKFGCPRPIAEQCQYNLLIRNNVEVNLPTLFTDYNYGTTIWSPLCSGLLTGKYNNGIPEDSRIGKNKNLLNLILKFSNLKSLDEITDKIKKLEKVAEKTKMTLPQLALAWVIKFKHTSTCILGASKKEQLVENIKCLELMNNLDSNIENEINEIFGNAESQGMDFKKLIEIENFRKEHI